MTKLFNLARMGTLTTGTGTVTLNTAVNGALSFDDAGVQDGDPVSYTIRDGVNSEVGRGTYTAAGTTLSRDTVLASTNGGAKIDLSGAAEVAVCMLVEDLEELFKTPAADVVVNEDGGDYNFRVEGDNDANLLFLDAGNDRAGIGMNAPIAKLHVSQTGQGLLYLHRDVGAAFQFIDQIFQADDDGGNMTDYVRLAAYPQVVTDGSETGGLIFYILDSGTARNRLQISSGMTVINEDGIDANFRVEGDSDANLLFLDAGNDAITIGGTAELGKLGVDGNADEVQFAVQGHSTQTANLVVFEKSDGSDLLTVSSDGLLDVFGGTYSLKIGADNSAVTRTDNTTKIGRIVAPHYTNAEEPVGMLQVNAQAGSNVVHYGGGTSIVNAATTLIFYTAVTNTTQTGTARLTINNVGDFTFFDGADFILGTSTGTKIGTAASQKIGFYGTTPVVQQPHIADADGSLADITTKFNALLAALEACGLLAGS